MLELQYSITIDVQMVGIYHNCTDSSSISPGGASLPPELGIACRKVLLRSIFTSRVPLANALARRMALSTEVYARVTASGSMPSLGHRLPCQSSGTAGKGGLGNGPVVLC